MRQPTTFRLPSLSTPLTVTVRHSSNSATRRIPTNRSGSKASALLVLQPYGLEGLLQTHFPGTIWRRSWEPDGVSTQPLLGDRRGGSGGKEKNQLRLSLGSPGQLRRPRRPATDQAAIQLPCQADQRQPSARNAGLRFLSQKLCSSAYTMNDVSRKLTIACSRVLEAMIQAPMRRQRVEAVVLDVPAGMAAPPQPTRRQLGLGQRRRPRPGRRLVRLLPLPGDPLSPLHRLLGAQEPAAAASPPRTR